MSAPNGSDAMSVSSGPGGVVPAGQAAEPDRRRWLVLGLAGLAQLMIVLDITIMNIALPSAQRALDFSNVDRQWVITAYALTFGSLLLLGGRLGDLLGRKAMFLTGLIGFAVASAVGGASTSFAMLVTARACQGAFGAVLAPAALGLLTTTFSVQRERDRAFGVFGAIAGGGGLVGLLLGGLLTEYLDWRWCLYVNLLFAGVAVTGATIVLPRQRRTRGARLDLPGALAVSASMFCLVYGFSNAANHTWGAPSTWGFLAAGVVLLAVFAAWQARAAHPLLPLRLVLDRNRGGSYLAVLLIGAGMFGIFLFLTYYLQTTLGYSPVMTGVAFLPSIAMIMVCSQLANVVLMPRIGPKPLVGIGMLVAAAGMVWLTRIGVHSGYASAVLGPLLVSGAGIGLSLPPSMNTGTFGVAPGDAGVASATLNVGQQIGGSIGTSLLNSIATTATASYLTSHLSPAIAASAQAPATLQAAAAVHGYTTAFWWTAGLFAAGAVIGGSLLRRGPLVGQAKAAPAGGETPQRQPAASAR
jgi:EmrB/QacA subfamily drug resistance transporter